MIGTYHVADLNVRGDLLACQEYAYAQIEQVPGASAMIGRLASQIWRSPEQFETPVADGSPVAARWRASSPTSGVLTLRVGDDLASLSLLASGISADADRITLAAFQRHLVRELRDTQTEPAFALLELSQRPIVATVNFLSPPAPADQFVVAMADRCFAAAYFRYHGLA